MKTIANAIAVGVLALIALRVVGTSVGPGPNQSSEILATDAGDITRRKFLLAYETNLKSGAASFWPRLKDEEFKDSFAAVKAWSEMTKEAREKASEGVNKRIEALAATPDQAVEWVKEFAR